MREDFCPSEMTLQAPIAEQCVCRCVHVEQQQAPDPVSLGLVGVAIVAAYLAGQVHRIRRRVRLAK